MSPPAETPTSRRRFLTLGLGSAAALVAGYTVGVERLPELARLRAPFGVWSVLGNHDHWADTTRKTPQADA